MADPDSRQGLHYANGAILDWVDRLHSAHDKALERTFTAPDREGMPPIQVGRGEGKLLWMLLRLIGARTAVEIGTLAGYSAMHIVRALGPDGRLWTIESEPHHAEVARANFVAAGVASQIEIVIGSALDVLPVLEHHAPFDAVFIDADKQNYPAYGEWAHRNLRSGGLLIADNAFLFGELLDDNERGHRMRQFHENTARDFATVCVPTPDGVLVGLKP